MFYSIVLATILSGGSSTVSYFHSMIEALPAPVAFVLFQDAEADKKEKAIKQPVELKPDKKAVAPDAKAKKEGDKPEDKQGTPADKKKDAPAPQWINMAVMMAAAFAFFYFIILRPQQRDREKRKNLIDSLKKNDRVVTIGGIIGTVANISEDGKEVTLKLDDNARVKMLRSSVSGPYNPDGDKKEESK